MSKLVSEIMFFPHSVIIETLQELQKIKFLTIPLIIGVIYHKYFLPISSVPCSVSLQFPLPTPHCCQLHYPEAVATKTDHYTSFTCLAEPSLDSQREINGVLEKKNREISNVPPLFFGLVKFSLLIGILQSFDLSGQAGRMAGETLSDRLTSSCKKRRFGF